MLSLSTTDVYADFVHYQHQVLWHGHRHHAGRKSRPFPTEKMIYETLGNLGAYRIA
jgi:hypothetical protein